MDSSSDWPVTSGEQATPDDPVTCALCGHRTSIAMVLTHFAQHHPALDLSGIADAPIVLALPEHDV